MAESAATRAERLRLVRGELATITRLLPDDSAAGDLADQYEAHMAKAGGKLEPHQRVEIRDRLIRVGKMARGMEGFLAGPDAASRPLAEIVLPFYEADTKDNTLSGLLIAVSIPFAEHGSVPPLLELGNAIMNITSYAEGIYSNATEDEPDALLKHVQPDIANSATIPTDLRKK